MDSVSALLLTRSYNKKRSKTLALAGRFVEAEFVETEVR
jgi:hypothetical protein